MMRRAMRILTAKTISNGLKELELGLVNLTQKIKTLFRISTSKLTSTGLTKSREILL